MIRGVRGEGDSDRTFVRYFPTDCSLGYERISACTVVKNPRSVYEFLPEVVNGKPNHLVTGGSGVSVRVQ